MIAWTPSEKVIRRMAEALGTDTDQLTVLADKIPSDIAHRLKDPEVIVALRRSMSGDFDSIEDFRKALDRDADGRG